MRYEDIESLLRWRVDSIDLRGLTPDLLVDSLSVEGLRYDAIPEEHYELVLSFRKRGREQRVDLCRRFLHEDYLGRDGVSHYYTKTERRSDRACVIYVSLCENKKGVNGGSFVSVSSRLGYGIGPVSCQDCEDLLLERYPESVGPPTYSLTPQ